MDRCALFVDAGYVLSDGANALHGTSRPDSVRWDHAGLLKLLADLARDRTGLPVLRCYWYEANADAMPGAEHDALAEIPGLKLRLRRAGPGRREGMEADLKRDLLTLARNHAISDALIVTGDENITALVTDAQDHGIRIIVAHITVDGRRTISPALRQECDDLAEIPASQLRPFAELAPGAVPVAHRHEAGAATSGQFPHDKRATAASGSPGVHAAGQFDSAMHSASQFASGAAVTGHYDTGMHAAPAAAAGDGQRDSGVRAAAQFDEAGRARGQQDAAAHAAMQRYDFGSAGQANAGPFPQHNGSVQPADSAQRNGQYQDPGYAGDPAGNGSAQHSMTSYGQHLQAQPANGQPEPDSRYSQRGNDQASFDGSFGPVDGQSRHQLPAAQTSHLSSQAAGQAGHLSSQAAGQAGHLSSQAAGQAGHLSAQAGGQSVPATGGPAGTPPGAPLPGELAGSGHPTGPDPVRPGYPGDQWYADAGQTVLAGQAGRDGQLPSQPPGMRADMPDPFSRPDYASHPDRASRPDYPASADRVGTPEYAARPGSVSRPDYPAQADRVSAPEYAARPGSVSRPDYNSLPERAGRPDYAAQPERAGRPDYAAQPERPSTPAPAPADQVTGANQVMRPDQVPHAGQMTQADQLAVAAHAARDSLQASRGEQARLAALAAPVYFPQQPGPAALQGPPRGVPQGRFDTTATPLHAATEAQLASAGHLVGAGRSGGSAASSALPAAPAPPPPVVSALPPVVSPAEAVRVAHGEGHSFGETVARDAPALWLDAVLARKPRMPSDLEARLLQGSALPIDSLLNDDVRQALRHGFWDALESSRH